MKETEPSPDTIIRLKDAVLNGFHALPSEHQATMGLAILDTVMKGEWGSWFRDTLTARFTVGENALVPPYLRTVNREDLRQIHLTEEQIDQLSDTDMSTIATLIHEHFITDAFWDELEFISDLVLASKNRTQNTAPSAATAEIENLHHDEPIPVSWVGKEDLLNARPDFKDKIAALGPNELVQLANKVGDGLQDTYRLVVGIVLDSYFAEEKNPPNI